MQPNLVFHASSQRGLKVIEPKESTHKKAWVYATKDISTSALFMGNNFDFICQTGIESGKPYIFERFAGALDLAYKDKRGSIYKLNGTNFKAGHTSWSAELVSERPENVIEEISISDVLKFLYQLEMKGKLKIYQYPKTPTHVPNDKSDLVKKAVQWTIDFGNKTLDDVKKYHPDILNRVLEELKKKNVKYS